MAVIANVRNPKTAGATEIVTETATGTGIVTGIIVIGTAIGTETGTIGIGIGTGREIERGSRGRGTANVIGGRARTRGQGTRLALEGKLLVLLLMCHVVSTLTELSHCSLYRKRAHSRESDEGSGRSKRR